MLSVSLPERIVGLDDAVPAALADAFRRYETALLAGDADTLDDLFAPTPDTLRADSAGLLVGADEIARFRRERRGVPSRTVDSVESVVLSDDVIAVVARTSDADRGPGVQTQVWQNVDGRWRIRVAHVGSAAQPVDRATWRVHAPALVAPTADGSAPGALHGVRAAVKDLFSVRGHRRGGGVPALLADAEPETEHADAVAQLLAAGATVVGITQCDELAFGLEGDNPHTGMPVNPRAPGRIPGGSSSGSAVAVASGQADLALSTDTAGSIRVPASYQGLWGVRTTVGAVGDRGMLHLAESFDAIGWISRDDATLESALVAHGMPTATEAPIAYATIPALAEHASAPVRDAVRRIGDAVCAVELHLAPSRFDDWFAAFRQRQAWEAWRIHGDWIQRHPGALSAPVLARFRAGAAVTDAEAETARAILDEATAAVREIVGDFVVVLPTAPGPAPTPGASERTRVATLKLNALSSFAALPAVTAPLLAAEGLPVGITVTAGPGREHDLLRAARGLLREPAVGPTALAHERPRRGH